MKCQSLTIVLTTRNWQHRLNLVRKTTDSTRLDHKCFINSILSAFWRFLWEVRMVNFLKNTIIKKLKKALIMLLYFYSRCVLIISLSLASLKVRNAVIRRYDKFGRISSSGSRQVVVMWDDNVGPSLSRVSPDSIILTEPPSLSSSRVHAKASF